MYRRIALSIVLAVSLISLSFLSSDSTARAQKENKSTWDTGVVTLGPNQILRITVALGDTGTHEVVARFRRMEYIDTGTTAGIVSKLTIASQTTSDPITLAPGGGLSTDFYSASEGRWVRGVVLSDSQDVRVTALIIDTTTGNVVNVNNLGSALGAPGN
jgi:hypothetical protein